MFGIFKSKKEKLYDKYVKLLKESHDLSTIDRAKSDLKAAEAEEIAKELDKMNR